MTDPVAVLLKFAFLAILYLFLLWVARSAMKDLRRPSADATVQAERAANPSPPGRPLLIAERGAGLSSGASFAVDVSTTIGRSPQTDIPIEDPFASGRHARIYERAGQLYVEDMGSTNGTYLNGRRLGSREQLHVDDRIRIGDTEFRYELG